MKFLLPILVLFGTTFAMHAYRRPQQHTYAQSLRASRSQPNNVFKSLGDFFHKMHVAATKRCAYLMDESCGNGGIPGAGSDSDWLNQGFTPGKRGLNLFDDSNGIIPGINEDSDFLDGGNTPGKRCVNTMDESCSNGGVPGSGSDNDWLNGGFNPGKRSLGDGEGIPGAGDDNEWLNGGGNPGRR